MNSKKIPARKKDEKMSDEHPENMEFCDTNCECVLEKELNIENLQEDRHEEEK